MLCTGLWCCITSPVGTHVSRPVAESIQSRTGRKQAQDPLGSLHILVFAGGVKFPQGEGSAVIRCKKNDLSHKKRKKVAACLCHSLWQAEFTCHRKKVVNRLKIPQGLSTFLFSPVEWSSLTGRGPRWFTVRKTTCFTKIWLHVCVSLWQVEFTCHRNGS